MYLRLPPPPLPSLSHIILCLFLSCLCLALSYIRICLIFAFVEPCFFFLFLILYCFSLPCPYTFVLPYFCILRVLHKLWKHLQWWHRMKAVLDKTDIPIVKGGQDQDQDKRPLKKNERENTVRYFCLVFSLLSSSLLLYSSLSFPLLFCRCLCLFLHRCICIGLCLCL